MTSTEEQITEFLQKGGTIKKITPEMVKERLDLHLKTNVPLYKLRRGRRNLLQRLSEVYKNER